MSAFLLHDRRLCEIKNQLEKTHKTKNRNQSMLPCTEISKKALGNMLFLLPNACISKKIRTFAPLFPKGTALEIIKSLLFN